MPVTTRPSSSQSNRTQTGEVVCLVDDDPSVRKAVSRLLESAGFAVRAFPEAGSFLEYLATNAVPVAVLDIWMERMTGLELLVHLLEKSPQTRVIFITGHEDATAKATVKQAGAFGFLIKPFDDEEFIKLVSRALSEDPNLPNHRN